MKKIFTIALLRDLEKQVWQGKISYSKMVEILNEKAWEGYSDRIEGEFDFRQMNKNIEDLIKNGQVVPSINSIQIGDDVIYPSLNNGPASINFEEIRPNAQDLDKMFGIENPETPETFFPVVLQSEKYKKLIAVQSHPETKYFFKDKEVSLEELTEILEGKEICELDEWDGGDETNLCDCGKGEGSCKRKQINP